MAVKPLAVTILNKQSKAKKVKSTKSQNSDNFLRGEENNISQNFLNNQLFGKSVR